MCCLDVHMELTLPPVRVDVIINGCTLSNDQASINRVEQLLMKGLTNVHRRSLQTSKAPLQSQAHRTSLFTSVATIQHIQRVVKGKFRWVHRYGLSKDSNPYSTRYRAIIPSCFSGRDSIKEFNSIAQRFKTTN